jgi:membrane protease YdiL (CAAX protease family)
MKPVELKRRTGLVAYFILAFAISWGGILLVMTKTGPRVAPDAYANIRLMVFVAMLAGPTLTSLGLTALLDRTQGLRELASRLGRWRMDPRWALAPLIAPAIIATVLGVLTVALGSDFAPAIVSSSTPGAIVAMAAVAGLGAGFFEELGWTGFATPRLLERWGWRRAGFVLGLAWAAWHGLADYWGGAAYGSLWSLHFLEWIVALTALRVFMTWAYSQTRSLLLAVLLHAASTGGQFLLWPTTSPRDELLWYGLFAFGLVLVATVVALPRYAATAAERRRWMHGDALVDDAMYAVTHAVTIDAPPERVWPWLTQMGAERAGWYSFDRIDNGGRPSASAIISELQSIARGDVMPAIPGSKDTFFVESVEPPWDLVLSVRGRHGTIVSWEHELEPVEGGRTRLIVRGRVSADWMSTTREAATPGRGPIFIERVYRVLGRLPHWALAAIAGTGHFVMEARHLRGIKQRAEAT